MLVVFFIISSPHKKQHEAGWTENGEEREKEGRKEGKKEGKKEGGLFLLLSVFIFFLHFLLFL